MHTYPPLRYQSTREITVAVAYGINHCPRRKRIRCFGDRRCFGMRRMQILGTAYRMRRIACGERIYHTTPHNSQRILSAYTVFDMVQSYTEYYYNIYNVSLYNFRYIMLIQVRRIFWGEKYFFEKILKNLLTTKITSVIIALQAGEEPRKEREE